MVAEVVDRAMRAKPEDAGWGAALPDPAVTLPHAESASIDSVDNVVTNEQVPANAPRPWARLPRPNVTSLDLLGRRLVCPVCRLSFVAWDVAPWALRALHDDTDLRRRYAGPDPIYYAAPACPGCNYAALGQDWYDIAPDVASRLRELLRRIQAEEGITNFNRDRDAALAQRAFELARRCYECRHQPPRHRLQGRLALYIAWCARDLGDRDGERSWLAVACRELAAALERDASLAARDELALGYLVGELAQQLGEPQRAMRYFHALLRHPAVGHHPIWERRLRDGCARAGAQLPRTARDAPARQPLMGRLLRMAYAPSGA